MFAVKHVVVFGEALFDVYASRVHAPEEVVAGPRAGGESRGEGTGRGLSLQAFPGGAPCNVAAWLAALGIPVSLVAGFSDDLLAGVLRREMSDRGIDLTHSVTLAGSRTPLALVTTGPGGERSFRLYLRGTPVEMLDPSHLESDPLAGAGWFHFGGVLPAFPRGLELTRHLALEAKRRSAATSCDVNIRPEVWEEGGAPFTHFLDLLKGVDLIKVSAEDFEWMRSRSAGALSSPEDLLSLGCRLVAFTMGAGGAELLAPGARARVEPPQVDVVDTTGAGDAFAAGLIAFFARRGAAAGGGFDLLSAPGVLREAGEFAAAVAGRALGRRGAMPSD